jgi:hypothetical protein
MVVWARPSGVSYCLLRSDVSSPAAWVWLVFATAAMLVMMSVVLFKLVVGAHNEARRKANKQLCTTTVIGTFQDSSVNDADSQTISGALHKTIATIGRPCVYAPRLHVLESSQTSRFRLETTRAGMQCLRSCTTPGLYLGSMSSFHPQTVLQCCITKIRRCFSNVHGLVQSGQATIQPVYHYTSRQRKQARISNVNLVYSFPSSPSQTKPSNRL